MMQSNCPLANYTYMKVGGPADFLLEVTTRNELIQAIVTARQINQRFIVIGAGSNTLFTDKGFRGLVIVNRTSNIEIDTMKYTLTAESGTPTNLVVSQANAAGLAGLEGFMGIPGSIGGAIYNNAHYLDHCIGEFVNQVSILDETNTCQTLSSAALQFGYDNSSLQHTPHIVLSVEFVLSIGDPALLSATSKQSLAHRLQTQPLAFPSSGCMFKNLSIPTADGIQSAGALIDKSGLKGKRVGGAEVSSQHANFIINKGGATTQDIIDLSNQIMTVVKDTFGVELQREVFIINEFGERVSHECV
jgi:UDP-N-acetylmuramate dehydrogenase